MFSLYMHWQNLQKTKKVKVLNALIDIVNESSCKPNKLWVDQGRKFYYKLKQQWLGSNDILMHSTGNEGKSVITERVLKALKAKIYKKNDSY